MSRIEIPVHLQGGLHCLLNSQTKICVWLSNMPYELQTYEVMFQELEQAFSGVDRLFYPPLPLSISIVLYRHFLHGICSTSVKGDLSLAGVFDADLDSFYARLSPREPCHRDP